MAQRVFIDPDDGVTDLVARLASDSKQLLADELRLARIEGREAVHEAGRGAVWLGLAFGIMVVALVAFTLFLATLIGRAAGGHHWIGALITAAIELAIGAWLVKRGLAALGRVSYSLPDTRASLTLDRA